MKPWRRSASKKEEKAKIEEETIIIEHQNQLGTWSQGKGKEETAGFTAVVMRKRIVEAIKEHKNTRESQANTIYDKDDSALILSTTKTTSASWVLDFSLAL